MPQDDKQEQTLLDSPDLAFRPRGAAATQPFDYKTGAGAESYARRQGIQSLREKMMTTGEESARDIGQVAKETYGPLYEPGQTLQRNASLWSLPYQAAAFSGMPLKKAITTGVGATIGGMGGAYAGGHTGHYLGGIPGRLMTNPQLEKQGAGLGEAAGAAIGGVAGGIAGGSMGYRGGGIPLKMKVAGLPIEGELPIGGVGRSGSAGDLASWTPDDLWQGYMRERGTPQGEALAREIQRRGLASSPAGTYRPPVPAEQAPSLKARVGAFRAGEGTSMARGDMPAADPSISQPVLVQQMQDAIANGTPEEAQMAAQRLREMGIAPLERFRSGGGASGAW